MKNINDYITEKFRFTDDMDFNKSLIIVNDLTELREIIFERSVKKPKHLDLSDLNVSNITSFINDDNSAFGKVKCSYVKSIDVTGWQTGQVENMSKLFSYFDNLEEIKGIKFWDVSNVKTMVKMFYECKKLKNINLNGWNINPDCVTTDMFKYCQKSIIPSWYND